MISLLKLCQRTRSTLHPQGELRSLRLDRMLQAPREQRIQRNIADLDIEELLSLWIERQCLRRSNQSWMTRLPQAQLKVYASLENIGYRHPRILKLAEIDPQRVNDRIGQYRGHLIKGPAGRCKSCLGGALGDQACRDGHRVASAYHHKPPPPQELKAP